MTKLTDTQLLILSRAAQRDDYAVEPPSDLKGAAAQKVIQKLLSLGLLEEVEGGPSMPLWRRDENERPVALVITAAGLEGIGISTEEQEDSSATQHVAVVQDETAGGHHRGPSEESQSAKIPRAGTKLNAVIQLLEREGGASIVDLTGATGWLPHTARAALTGLRKRGYRIATARGEDHKTVYRIVGSATIDEREGHADLAGDGEA